MQTAITNCRVFTGEQVFTDKVLVVEDGRVHAVMPEPPPGAELVDAGGNNIAAGLIDIQINGGSSIYFSDSPSEAALHDIYDTSLEFGTTHILPCLISAPQEKILEAIEAVRHFMERYPEKGVLGMHLEGPYLNPGKRGAHSAAIIRKPTMGELEEIIRYGKDVISVMTIAPELFTDEQVRLLLDNNITVSAGHSMMSYEEAQHCFQLGIKLVTHLYNAMTQMGHREPGLVGATFDNENVYAPIILDGAHCHYAAARIAYQVKKDKLILLSDAAFLGRKVKSFRSELLDASLQGLYYRNDEGNLAGAAISMVEAVQNAVKQVGIPLQEAVEMATIHVARAIGKDHLVGKIAKGYPAQFILFDNYFSNPQTLIIR